MNSKKYCTSCGSPIMNNNRFCTNCGVKTSNSLSNTEDSYNGIVVRDDKEVRYHNPLLSALLSFFLLCFGQFYNGQILKGIIFVLILYFLIMSTNINPIFPLLSLVFLFFVAYDAYKNSKKINEGFK